MLQASCLRVALRAVANSSVMVLGLAATLVLSAPAARAQISFLTAPTYPVGDSPTSIAVGDLDGDGDLDLATANCYSNNASVLKNNGNGTFAAPQNFAVGRDPRSITVGDLDGDGDLDLGTANSFSDNVSVLKNKGDGTFAAPQNFAAGDGSNSITVGDLDGDGDLDLGTANFSDVSVLKNNGNGTFAAPQNFAVGGDPRSITVGDLDGDGDLDLATARFSLASSSNVIVLESTTPTLQLSLSPDRTNPVPLAGESVSGNIYVFASGQDPDFKRVQFYLDDADRSGEPIRLERSAPFDFAGGTEVAQWRHELPQMPVPEPVEKRPQTWQTTISL